MKRRVKKHIVLVGAGHAHLLAISRIPDFLGQGHRVTVIGPDPYQYYSGMGPGLLSGIYRPQDVRFHIEKMTEQRGGTFVRDLVVEIDPKHKILKLKRGETVTYDLVSFNTGSRIPELKSVSGDLPVIPAKPVVNLYHAHQLIMELASRQAVGIVIVGGGAAGVEIAANAAMIDRHVKHNINVTLISRRRILNSFLPRAQRIATSKLQALGVSVIENCSATSINEDCLDLSDGRCLFFDIVLLAAGTKPHRLFEDSKLPTGPDGGLLVNQYLQSTEYPSIFGGGDCIHFSSRPLEKVGVYAVREAPLLFHNLLAAAGDRPLRPFIPQRTYMLILNLGNRAGILQKKPFVLSGKWMFKLKDHIDRAFMRRYQLSGETAEKEN